MTHDDDTPGLRLVAARRARDEGDTESLIDYLRDPAVRTMASDFLGELGDETAIPPLVQLLQANDKITRVGAVQALGRIGSPSACPPLLEVVDDDPELLVRAWAIDALGEIGDRSVVDRLLQLLEDDEHAIRRTAATALGRIGDPSAREAIAAAARAEPPWRRRLYRQALRMLEQTSAR